jgi:hypothetical protein
LCRASRGNQDLYFIWLNETLGVKVTKVGGLQILSQTG